MKKFTIYHDVYGLPEGAVREVIKTFKRENDAVEYFRRHNEGEWILEKNDGCRTEIYCEKVDGWL